MMNGGLISQYTVSMEAIREYEVTTNEYNVLEGRQGGGSVNRSEERRVGKEC